MLNDKAHRHHTERHTHQIVLNPHDRAVSAARLRRAQRWSMFGRRDEASLAQRCLALHLHFAGPHSALD